MARARLAVRTRPALHDQGRRVRLAGRRPDHARRRADPGLPRHRPTPPQSLRDAVDRARTRRGRRHLPRGHDDQGSGPAGRCRPRPGSPGSSCSARTSRSCRSGSGARTQAAGISLNRVGRRRIVRWPSVGEPLDLSRFRGKEPSARTLREITDEIMTAVRDRGRRTARRDAADGVLQATEQVRRQGHDASEDRRYDYWLTCRARAPSPGPAARSRSSRRTFGGCACRSSPNRRTSLRDWLAGLGGATATSPVPGLGEQRLTFAEHARQPSPRWPTCCARATACGQATGSPSSPPTRRLGDHLLGDGGPRRGHRRVQRMVVAHARPQYALGPQHGRASLSSTTKRAPIAARGRRTGRADDRHRRRRSPIS